MTGPLSKIGKAAKAIKKATAKAPVKTFKTADGYTFYELPNGSIVDNLKPSQVDMSWPSRQEFMSDMEGTAFEAGDELGQRRATTESIGVPTQEKLMENITQFGEDDISKFYKARREQLIDQERKANIRLVPGQEEDMAAGGALKKTIKAAQKVGEKSARQEALNMARGIAKESFVRPSQEKGVVYHGTNKDITKFKRTLTPDDHVPGISVTDDPASASLYAEDKAMKQTAGEGANVLPLLVRTEKPMYYPDLEDWTRNKALEKGFPIKDPDDFAAFDVPPETLLKWLKEEGYDAIDYRDDPMMGYGLRVFDPEQLKSAIGNRTYDPRNPDITKAKGGAIDHDLKAWHEKNMAKGGKVKEETKESEPALPHPEVLKYMSLDDLVNPEVNFPRRYPGQTTALPSDLASDSNKEVQDRRLKHGALDAVNWAVRNLPQPVNPVLQSMRNIVDARKRRLGAFSLPPDIMEASGILILPEELTPIEDKKPSVPRFNHGGEVRMSNGGASEYEGFFESGLPPEPPAKEILVGRGVRRKEPRIGEIFETPAQAVQGALGAFGSAGKGALQATVGLPGDIISIGRGIGAAVSPQPGEDRLGAFLRGMEGETGLPTTEDVKKFLDQYGKAPFEQFETLGEFTGIPILAAPKVSGAIGRAAEDVAPYLRDLPVGASTKPVGQTTEEWLKSLEIPPKPQGSKMKVYAPADDLGLYSKMEKAALNFKRKEGTGDAWLADFKNAGVSDEELEFSGMKEILANMTQPRTRETIAVYAKQRRMPLQVVRATEGTDAGDFKFREAEVIDDTDYIKSRAEDIEADFDNEYPGGTDALRARIMQDFTDEELNDPHILASIDETVEANKKQEAYDRAYTEYYDNPYYRSYNDAGYEIVGNRDVGFTVKDPNGNYLMRKQGGGEEYPRTFNNLEIAESFANQHALDTGLMKENDVKFSKYQLDRGTDYEEMKIILPQPLGKRPFHSDHWDEEDVLSHYRTQRRVDTSGKEMLYVDEIQSDWHQAGRDYGYFTKEDQVEFDKINKRISNLNEELMKVSKERSQLYRANEDLIKKQIVNDYRSGVKDESEIDISMIVKRFDQLPEVKDLEKKEADLYAQRRGIIEERQKFSGKVPDVPFKDTWHELTVKAILHDAAQKGFERVGFSAAKPHIDRWGTEAFAWEKQTPLESTKQGYYDWMKSWQKEKVSDEQFQQAIDESWADKSHPLVKAFLKDVERSGGWKVVSQEQRGGQAGGVNLEAEARARGILKGKTGQEIKTRDDLKRIVEDTLRDPTELKVERITNKVWKSMNKTDVGIHEPRKEGMQFFYDEALKKFLEKYANKIGGRFYETETKTGRGVSEEGPKDITEKVYMFEFTPEAKDTAVKGQPYKKGGLVKKDKDLMRWHKIQQLAAGGAIRKLAKSAEKALEKAKRMTREEAEKAGLWHDISDIKLEKPLSEVQKKVVKNPKSKLAEKKVISPEELQGGTAVQLLGDRAAAGQILEELEGVPMNIELQGGPGFMREHGGWASHKVPLSKLEKKIRTVQESGDPVYGVYTAMGPQGVDFNTFVSESLVKSLDLSELRKKDIDKFNQEVRKDIPGFVGIESPGLLESLIIGPGAQRTKFVQTMAKEDFQKAGFPNVGFARYAVTEPELLDVPIGQAGYSISQFGPEMKMEQKSGHRTYPYDLTGTYVGGLAQPLPAEVMFPSFFEARRLLSKPESGGYRAMQMSAPVQQLDQEWLDNAMQYLEMQKKLTGKKKGGLASIKVRNKRNG